MAAVEDQSEDPSAGMELVEEKHADAKRAELPQENADAESGADTEDAEPTTEANKFYLNKKPPPAKDVASEEKVVNARILFNKEQNERNHHNPRLLSKAVHHH